MPSFRIPLVLWTSTVLTLNVSVEAISLLLWPQAVRRSTWVSRGVRSGWLLEHPPLDEQAHQAPIEFGIEVGTSARHRPDGAHQLARAALLERVAGRAGPQQFAEIAFLSVPRECQHLDRRGLLPDGRGGLQAVHAGHADIHQQNVGPERHGRIDGLLAIDGLPDDLEVGLAAEE